MPVTKKKIGTKADNCVQTADTIHDILRSNYRNRIMSMLDYKQHGCPFTKIKRYIIPQSFSTSQLSGISTGNQARVTDRDIVRVCTCTGRVCYPVFKYVGDIVYVCHAIDINLSYFGHNIILSFLKSL